MENETMGLNGDQPAHEINSGTDSGETMERPNDCPGELDGAEDETFLVRVRVQLLFPSVAVIRALWKFQYARTILRHHYNTDNEHDIVLLDHAYHRLNAHDGLIDYTYCLRNRAVLSTMTPTRTSNIYVRANNTGDQQNRLRQPTTITLNDARLVQVANLRQHMHARSQRQIERQRFLSDLLEDQQCDTTSHRNHLHSITFWKDTEWWRQRLVQYRRTQHWWHENIDNTPGELDQGEPLLRNQSFRRICRLLNHLVRVLLDEHGVNSTHEATELLLTANEQECSMLNKLYVEPPIASPFAAYLSTTFMHHKQQHGLNTKHAAAKGDTDTTSSDTRQQSSKRDFDPKIYLDMCSSCDKKDIFELMLSLDKNVHSEIPCNCHVCTALCNMANAWKYYDCIDSAWLRLEFNRRFYNKVSTILDSVIMQPSNNMNSNNKKAGTTTSYGYTMGSTTGQVCASDATAAATTTTDDGARGTTGEHQSIKIIYLSYKNEFTERSKFIANFVNYYAFYENDERPVSRDDCHGELREKISIIFIFALVNWKLIEQAMKRGTTHNSISLNQQSIFKSLDNTLYAIFSENSINRMAKEQKQRLLSINAPYVNRGFGSLPNCGMNAITTTIL